MKSITHIDADAFFASVEQAADRRLRGLPVAVGGGYRGVVCSVSYEARQYGVRTAMPTHQALKLCPELILLKGQFDLYEQFSDTLFDLCRDETPYVEQTSIDEGYLDFGSQAFDLRGITLKVRKLDQSIHELLKVTVSSGVGANKLVAQVASKWRKPHGMVIIPPGSEQAFFRTLPLIRLPGLGPKRVERLEGIGIRTLGDLVRMGGAILEPILGQETPSILERACGKDESPLVFEKAPAQSFGEQESFEEDTADEALVEWKAKWMLENQLKRLRAHQQQARTLTLAIRYADHEEASGSYSLKEPSFLFEDFLGNLRPLIKRVWSRRVRLRRIRIQLSRLYPAVFQDDYFGIDRKRLRTLAHVGDQLVKQFGKGALVRASQIAVMKEV